MTSPFQQGDKIVAYCRYSEGDEQGLKNTSTDEQEAAIRKFCDENGLEVVKVFADPFASGRSIKGRDKYKEMLSFLLHKKKPDIQGIVLWDFERYGRNYNQAQYDAAKLRMAGYKIYSLQQPVVDDGPFAHVLEAMYFASAQNQSDMISADVKRALQHNFQTHRVIPRSCIPDGWMPVSVDMGFYSDGSPRVGYRAEPDPQYLSGIREAIDARLHGASISEMRKIIGGKFALRPEKVVKLMSKPLLYGSFTYGGTEMENYCSPIIDKETYNKLQLYNETAPKKTRRPGSGAWSKDRALLSDLAYCGVCGEKAYINRRKAKGHTYETYYCNHKHAGYSRDVLDDLVLEKAQELLTGQQWQDTKKRILDSFSTADTGKIDKASVREEIAKIDKKITTLTDMLAEAGLASRALLLKIADLEAQREDLNRRLASAQNVTPIDMMEKTAESLRDSILEVLNNEKSSTDDLRTALSLFISAVILYPDGKILIHHTLPGLRKVETFPTVPSSQVESEPPHNLIAPPDDEVIHSQHVRFLVLVCWAHCSKRPS